MDALREVYGGSRPHRYDPLEPFPGTRALLEDCEGYRSPASPEDAINCLLEAAINRFGCSACDVFNAVFNPHAVIQRHEGSFTITYADLEAAARALLSGQSADFGISHRTLALSPVYRGLLKWPAWTVNFKSDWIAKNVVQKLGTTEETAILQQVRFLQRIPAAMPLVKWFSDPLAHRCIAETATGGFWPLTNMVSDATDPRRCVVLRDSRVPNDVQFAKVKRKVVKFQSTADLPIYLENNVYHTPKAPIFPLLDAFTVDLDRSKKSAVLWVLQIVMSQSPGGSVVGNQKISDMLRD